MHYSAVNHEISHVGDWHDEGKGLDVFDNHTLSKENNTDIETLGMISNKISIETIFCHKHFKQKIQFLQ